MYDVEVRVVRCSMLAVAFLGLAAAGAAAQSADRRRGVGPAVRPSGDCVAVREGHRTEGHADVRLVWKLLHPDPERRALRRLSLGGYRLPEAARSSGQAERGSLYEYATGRLVLWTRNDSGIDVRRGLTVLADARVRRIAIANPEHAPYGRAAVAALRHEGLYERVQGKFVLGENISQAAQFAAVGQRRCRRAGALAGVVAGAQELRQRTSTSRSPGIRPSSRRPSSSRRRGRRRSRGSSSTT